MERVYYQQEQMLDELKDLVDKGLFTEQETKAIMKKRTAYETALVRRVAKKADYLRYAAYEMGLEQLRRKRKERMKIQTGPATLSDYALVRRQFHIFERAVKKFKADVALWVQYIQVAKHEGARALVGRITARALQLHPNKPALFILAAQHELEQHSPSAARTLLQRGIRMNGESVEMWKEYVKMELGFIESLRRRWDVLGIKIPGADAEEEKKRKRREDPSSAIMGERIDGDVEEEEEEEEEARRKVMEGGIVGSVMGSAVQAVPRLEMFEAIKGVIADYPCTEELRQRLLEELYGLLARTLPKDGRAVVMCASRYLPQGVTGKGLVRGLQRATEEILGCDASEEKHEAYVGFVEEWCSRDIDSSLKQYLVGTVEGLIAQGHDSGSLLAGHIRLTDILGARASSGRAMTEECGRVAGN